MARVAIKLLTSLIALVSVASAAGVSGLRVDGVLLPQASMGLLLAGLPTPTHASDFEAAVIENRLLAEWAQLHLSADSTHGIDREVEAEVMQVLGAQFPTTTMPPVTLLPIDEAVWRRVMKPSSAANGFELTPQQRQQAAALKVAQLPAAKPNAQVTLLDVYERESIQGLAELHGMSREYLQRQATALLQQRWQLQRWQDEGKFDAASLAGLTRIVRDKQIKQRWLQEQGLIGDFHHESTVARDRWRRVSPAAIKQYYDANLERFRQVDQIEADVLLLRSQADADTTYQALRGGLSFGDAIRRQGAPGSGSLGVLRNDGSATSLLQKLALLQQVGISRPFRAGEQWAIYQVRERRERLLPVTDASVQHECARAVAKIEAQSEFDELRQRLRRGAKIERIDP